MFSHIYQSGFLSLFYSEGGHPLEIWQAISPSPLPASVTEANGTNNCSSEDLDATIQFTDDDMIHGRVLQLWSSDSRAVYIMCPARLGQSLSIRLPFVVLLMRSMSKYFSLEVGLRDNRGTTRRFRLANYQKKDHITDELCLLPLQLDDDWNQLRIDLANLVRRAYGSTYTQCDYIRVHANCRLKRIYFTDQLLAEDQLPPEFKLYQKDNAS